MCGIYFSCGNPDSEDFKEFESKCLCMLRRRGPDLEGLVEEGQVKLFSTVLWLQGKEGYRQPTVTDEFAFLWNGDIFEYNGNPLPSDVCDTEFVVNELRNEFKEGKILDIVERIQGPWAFVLWDKLRNQLWFGRDFFGRQSLLLHTTSDNNIVISSCVPNDSEYKFVEVPAQGVFKLNLNDTASIHEGAVLYPWNSYIQTLKVNEHFTLGALDFKIDERILNSPIVIDPIKCDDTSDVNVTDLENTKDLFDVLLLKPEVIRIVDEFIDKLTAAVQLRIENQPGMCKVCIKDKSACEHPCVGVLFSGGLDSTVLAFLAAKLLIQKKDFRGLDLMNVAFAQAGGSYNVPDRLTGLQAFQEIRELLPEYPVRMISVDIPLEQLKINRKDRIQSLLYPLNTVLDDSIGCAIWFAARGEGQLLVEISSKDKEEEKASEQEEKTAEQDAGELYRSGCRVLLTGMGIDEQLGGYSRHRSRYEREGLSGLEDELGMEILRISERNLGRDNRIISDHGVMARFPFLDENFVNYVSKLPTLLKCNLKLPRGVGEKLVLRLAAHKLGLVRTAREPKRAVQFGSRIAKLENRKEKASDTAVRL